MCKTEPLLQDAIIQKAQQRVGLNSQSGPEIEDNSLQLQLVIKETLDGTTFYLDRQPDILKQYSKITSLQQDNGIVPHFGPRISCWHRGNLDGQFGNTGMS
jgi:hypothetical protein